MSILGPLLLLVKLDLILVITINVIGKRAAYISELYINVFSTRLNFLKN